MLLFDGVLTRDYAWELALFHHVRRLADGLSFFELDIAWDRYRAEHSPRFRFYLAACNYTLVEFTVYYRHHRETWGEGAA